MKSSGGNQLGVTLQQQQQFNLRVDNISTECTVVEKLYVLVWPFLNLTHVLTHFHCNL